MIREKSMAEKLQKLGWPYLFTEALMLVPIDFLSCSGSLEKLAVGQFFLGALAAEKINGNSAWLQSGLKQKIFRL